MKRGLILRLAGWAYVAGLSVLFLALMAAVVRPAFAAGTTWYVTTATDDEADGDVATHSGSFRFALGHATSGDFVSFANFDTVVDTIFVSAPLTVPAGVAVGHHRSQTCGTPSSPLVNIQAVGAVNPVFSLGAGSTLRNLNIGGGYTSVRITGQDVDICGAGLGIVFDGNVAISLPPLGMSLLIDGAGAIVHRNYINADMVASTLASDTRIGDALAGSGDANRGFCGNGGKCALTILADVGAAAQRVTVRDPFPRALAGMPGLGVTGGDDDPSHANNWAQTPDIVSASSVTSPTLVVHGSANPLSLVDVYLDDRVTTSRQASVRADGSGAFTYTGAITRPVNAGELWVFAASTLDDPAHAARVGSTSELSDEHLVVSETVGDPELAATGSMTVVAPSSAGPAHAGDTVRFSVAMSNTGTVEVVAISSNMLTLPTGFDVVPGSGIVSGGAGFIGGDGGFSGGSLPPGQSASYSLDMVVSALAPVGQAVASIEVGGYGIIALPVVGRIQVAPDSALTETVWLPVIENR